MNIIYIREGLDIYQSDFNKLKSKYARSSIIQINKSTLKDGLTVLDTKPMFNEKYLVIIDCMSVTNSILLEIAKKDNTNFFICSRRVSDLLLQLFTSEEISYKLLDTTRPTLDQMITYVREVAPNLNKDIASYLINRCHKNLKILDTALASIVSLNLKTKEDIKKFIPQVTNMSLNEFVSCLLVCDEKHYKKATKVLYQYRYGTKFLVQFCRKQLELYMDIYAELYYGNLNEFSIKSWLSDNKGKREFKDFTEHRVKHILGLFDRVSYDKICLIDKLLKDISKDSWYTSIGILDILEMAKLGGK